MRIKIAGNGLANGPAGDANVQRELLAIFRGGHVDNGHAFPRIFRLLDKLDFAVVELQFGVAGDEEVDIGRVFAQSIGELRNLWDETHDVDGAT